MKSTASAADHLRALLRRLRHSTDRASALVGPWMRATRYAWHLVIWSRITAGRRGLMPIELPAAMLAHKGVHLPPPRLRVGGGADASVFERGFAEVYALLFANLQSADLLSRHRHAIPGPAFRGVYLWDSAFIAQVWAWWDTRVAREVLLAVIELRAGDRLQHVVSELTQSRYTQPPLVAWSVLRLARRLGPSSARALIAEVYRPLAAYQRWLDRHRRLDNGLYAWAHPYESGVENAPRFSNTDESQLRDTRAMAAPDLCSYVVLQLDALAEMARLLERRPEADHHAAAAARVRERVNALLWSERDGLYLDLDGAGVRVPVATIASLLPLWAGIPDRARAERLRQRIMSPAHFGTQIPLPSVDRSAHCFEKDMWRGPVWINTGYAVIQGLLRYGYDREAGELAYRLCRGVYRVFANEQLVYEFYDPDAFHTRDLRRKRGNWWKALTLGRGPQRDFVGWTGLVNTLLLEVLLGVEAGPADLSLCPRLPSAAAGLRLDLQLPDPAGRLTLTVGADGGVAGTWRAGGGPQPVQAGFAERIALPASPERTVRCATVT